MPETSVLNFSHQEVLEILIKKADIHDGTWELSFQLHMLAGSIPGPNKAPLPGAAILIQGIALQRVQPGTPIAPGGLVIDAAKINPTRRNA